MLKYDQFLQSEGWANFMKSLGHTVIPFEGYFGFKKNMKYGFSHFYVPRILINEDRLDEINKMARQLKCDFIRIEPLNTFDSIGYKKIIDHNPSHTLVIDLMKSEEDLLAEMHQKTRYNIRLAEKKGVTFKSGGLQHFDDFWGLIESTYIRKNITTFSKKHYRSILEHIDTSYIAFATFKDTYIVANLMIEYGDTITYLHGGSEKKYQNVMGAQFLQWHEIKDAKNRGLKFYDFWGVAPNDDPKHPWAGVSRFKRGFGGEDVSYPGTFEKGLNWKYTLYKLLNNLR